MVVVIKGGLSDGQWCPQPTLGGQVGKQWEMEQRGHHHHYLQHHHHPHSHHEQKSERWSSMFIIIIFFFVITIIISNNNTGLGKQWEMEERGAVPRTRPPSPHHHWLEPHSFPRGGIFRLHQSDNKGLCWLLEPRRKAILFCYQYIVDSWVFTRERYWRKRKSDFEERVKKISPQTIRSCSAYFSPPSTTWNIILRWY